MKATYALAVTPAERDAVRRALLTCPDQRLTPDPTHAPTEVDQHVTDPGPLSTSATGGPATGGSAHAAPTTPATGGSAPAPFARCDDARASGAAPLHRGDPGWSDALDRDHDCPACE